MGRRMICPTTGKQVFFSREEARNEIEFMSKARKMIAYLCKDCGKIHLSTAKKGRKGRDQIRV